nr:flagellar export protein FliJ [Oleiagrimonas sp. C23AA]
MQRVADLAESRSDEAARILGEHQRALREAESQLEELGRFRKEYETMAPGQGVTVAEMLNRQRFVHRIDQAMTQQRSEIQRRRQSVEGARARWLEVRNRHAALDSVTRRYRNQEERAEERRDQEAVDERSQHRRGGPGHD